MLVLIPIKATVRFKGTVQPDLFGWKWYHLRDPSERESPQEFQRILPIISHVERPYEFPHYLVRALEIIFIEPYFDTDMETNMEMKTDKKTWKWKRNLKIYGHGHRIGALLLSI